jgi:hypothetical protein
LRPEPLEELELWVEKYRRLWAENFRRLDGLLDEMKAKEKKRGRKKR